MEGNIYTTGEFAKKADVSVRTIRYYDKQGLLKPSSLSASGYRLYTDDDFARLQKILTLKYLGFSLEEIQEISLRDTDNNYVQSSLDLQLGLVKKKIESLKLVEESLKETSRVISRNKEIDWQAILHLIHLISMEKSLMEQYKTGANTSARICLHRDYGVNPQGWFGWIYDRLALTENMSLLELGAGNGEMWRQNIKSIPAAVNIWLSDVSSGMIKDAGSAIKKAEAEMEDQVFADHFHFAVFDCHRIPYGDSFFERVLANHLLFYLKDIHQALSEVARVLKADGIFICSTYGRQHMREISDLVKEFDPEINLSNVPLHEVFGLENGREILGKHFSNVSLIHYPDKLLVTEPEPIIEYILSCHGNQREYIQGRYEEFSAFVKSKLIDGKVFAITKEAGIFCCRK